MRAGRCEFKPRAGRRTVRGARRGAYPKTPRQNTGPLGSSDHNQLHFNINIKSDKTKVKQCRRDFRKGNYREIRKNLAHIDWDEKMKNKNVGTF